MVPGDGGLMGPKGWWVRELVVVPMDRAQGAGSCPRGWGLKGWMLRGPAVVKGDGGSGECGLRVRLWPLGVGAQA